MMSAAQTSRVRNPDWTEDELILALDVYLSTKPKDVQKHSHEVTDLSGVLNRLHRRLGTDGSRTLRNPAGVYMKIQNLKAHDPTYLARGKTGLKAGNRLEAEVWKRYGTDVAVLRSVAHAIRAFIDSDLDISMDDPADDTSLAPEGRILVRVHRVYERRPENKRRKLEAFRKQHGGRIFCECCGFDFEARYGDRGKNFIECHHEIPVSSLSPATRLKLTDLRLLCSNCHRMIHVAQPWWSVDRLREELAR